MSTIPTDLQYTAEHEWVTTADPATTISFTIEADMGHDAWIRTYMGRDLYDWFLAQGK